MPFDATMVKLDVANDGTVRVAAANIARALVDNDAKSPESSRMLFVKMSNHVLH